MNGVVLGWVVIEIVRPDWQLRVRAEMASKARSKSGPFFSPQEAAAQAASFTT